MLKRTATQLADTLIEVVLVSKNNKEKFFLKQNSSL